MYWQQPWNATQPILPRESILATEIEKWKGVQCHLLSTRFAPIPTPESVKTNLLDCWNQDQGHSVENQHTHQGVQAGADTGSGCTHVMVVSIGANPERAWKRHSHISICGQVSPYRWFLILHINSKHLLRLAAQGSGGEGRAVQTGWWIWVFCSFLVLAVWLKLPQADVELSGKWPDFSPLWGCLYQFRRLE